MADSNAEWSDDEDFSGKFPNKVKRHLIYKNGKKRTKNIKRQEAVDFDSSVIKEKEVQMSPDKTESLKEISTEMLDPVSLQPNSNSGKEMPSPKKEMNLSSNWAKSTSEKKIEPEAEKLVPKINSQNELDLPRNSSPQAAITKSSLLSTPAKTTEPMNSPKYVPAAKLLETDEYLRDRYQETREISTEMLDPASPQPNSNIGKEMPSPKKEMNLSSNWAKSTSEKKIEPEAEKVVPKINSKNELDLPRTSSPQAAITKSSLLSTPAKTTEPMNSPKYVTAANSLKEQPDILLNPSLKMLKPETSKIRVPSSTLSEIKPSATSMRSILCRSNKNKNVKSPIKSSIKESAKVPTTSNVNPRKQLPGKSMIPKLINSFKIKPRIKTQNKENMNTLNCVNQQPIPSVAYKTAKKTKTLHVPPKEDHPSPSAKKPLSPPSHSKT